MREKQVACDVFWFLSVLNLRGSDDGTIYAWSKGTRGHLAGRTLPRKRRGGGITCFPVGDAFVSSSNLFLKAPPFISNWAVGFAIVCVLCLVFGWVRVQAATMIEGRERTGDFGPWRVPCNISAWGTFFVPERNPCL
jgi:hypothetical protein